MPMTNINLDRFFNRPPSCQSRTKSADINSGARSPVLQAQRFPFVCQHHIGAHVAALLSTSGPPAITRLVISAFVWIAINAVQDRWSLAHILKKRLKRISPPCTHLNAVRTIPMVVFIATVVASRQHGHPRAVCRRLGFTVRDWAFAAQSVSKAATACTACTAKAAAGYSAHGATFASAVPHGATLLIQPSVIEYGPSSDKLSGQIFYAARRNCDRIGISHVSTPLSERNVVRAVPELELRYRSLLLQNLAA